MTPSMVSKVRTFTYSASVMVMTKSMIPAILLVSWELFASRPVYSVSMSL